MAKFTWISRKDGDWTVAEDWDRGTVPTADDSAYVPLYAHALNRGPDVTAPIAVAYLNVGGNLFFDDAGSSTVATNVAAHGDVGLYGSSLTIRGTLKNEGPYNSFGLSADAAGTESHVTAQAVDNQGYLTLDHSTLTVGSTASFGRAGIVDGVVELRDHSRIEFTGTGQISTIATGALLLLGGGSAIVDADDALKGSNALRALRSINGALALDPGQAVYADGRVNIAADGELDLTRATFKCLAVMVNRGWIIDRTPGNHLLANGALVNYGRIDLGQGLKTSSDLLKVRGRITNDGTMSLSKDTEAFSNDLIGSGSVSLSLGSTLTLDGAVSDRQSFHLGVGSTLALSDPTGFAATVYKFDGDDAFVIHGFDANTSFVYTDNASHTAGVLTVSDGAAGHAQIHMAGAYATSDFHIASGQNGVTVTLKS